MSLTISDVTCHLLSEMEAKHVEHSHIPSHTPVMCWNSLTRVTCNFDYQLLSANVHNEFVSGYVPGNHNTSVHKSGPRKHLQTVTNN